jgi:endonuclease YncB( thermonuclease family)
VGAGHFLKIYLSVSGLFLFIAVQPAAVELSGNAKTIPESGVIELQRKELSLNGVQIISQNATCKDSNGQWSCGKSAWEALKIKLDSGPVHCTLISDLQNTERNPKQANCLLKKENLSSWLVSQGWALTSKEPEEFLSSQENLAMENNEGIWRDGFIPPDLWRTSFKKDFKHCNVCSVRRQSFLRKTPKQK